MHAGAQVSRFLARGSLTMLRWPQPARPAHLRRGLDVWGHRISNAMALSPLSAGGPAPDWSPQAPGCRGRPQTRVTPYVNDWPPARCKGQRVLPEHHGVSSPRTGIWRCPLGLRLSALAMWGGSGDGERAASSQSQTSGNPPSPDAQGKRKGTFFCNRQVPRPRSPSSTLRQSSGPSARLNSSRHRTQTATAPREPVPSGGQFRLWKAGGRGGGSVPLPPPLRWSGPTRNMLILKQSAFGSSHEKLNVGVVS